MTLPLEVMVRWPSKMRLWNVKTDKTCSIFSKNLQNDFREHYISTLQDAKRNVKMICVR